MVEELLTRVGKKGEIYTTKRFREVAGLAPGTRIILKASETGVLIEKVASIEELMKDYLIEITPEEAEQLSKEAQKGVAKTIGRKSVA